MVKNADTLEMISKLVWSIKFRREMCNAKYVLFGTFMISKAIPFIFHSYALIDNNNPHSWDSYKIHSHLIHRSKCPKYFFDLKTIMKIPYILTIWHNQIWLRNAFEVEACAASSLYVYCARAHSLVTNHFK